MLAGVRDDLAASGWWDDDWIERTVTQAPAALDAACARWRELYRAALTEQFEQNRLVNDPTSTQALRRSAEARRREAEAQLRLLRNEDSDRNNTDFYPYRYFASEGFLPGYSFPRLPLAAFIPGLRRRLSDGDFLQRPRFLAISEFGPGALIYHEGARYQVTRIQLPGSAATPGSIDTATAKRCRACGYLHDGADLLDDCRHCGARLGTAEGGLLQLRTVFTRRRERISSDEEERRRQGFELEVSYAFADRGARPGSTSATATHPDGHELLDLTYGDAATVRVTNVGLTRRKHPGERGFWLDTINGRWLSDKQGSESTASDELDDAGQAKFKTKVIPYVEDTRNILITRLPHTADLSLVATLQHALERGHRGRVPAGGLRTDLPTPARRRRAGPAADRRIRRRRCRGAAPPGRRTRSPGPGRPHRPGPGPLRPRHRCRPDGRRDRGCPLREGLLRLPALLLQPGRPRQDRPAPGPRPTPGPGRVPSRTRGRRPHPHRTSR